MDRTFLCIWVHGKGERPEPTRSVDATIENCGGAFSDSHWQSLERFRNAVHRLKENQRCPSKSTTDADLLSVEIDQFAKSLQQFFDIEGEPIELTDDRKSGRCTFKIKSEDNSNSQRFF